jgi:hypothetical protein
VQFYDRLFTEQFSWQPKLNGLAFVHEEEASWLERPFEKSEVLKMVKGINNEKTPSPDDFTMAFFQVCRDVIKADIMGVFHDFHTRSKFEKKP